MISLDRENELRIDMDEKWYDFIKENNISAEYNTILYYNNRRHPCLFKNEAIRDGLRVINSISRIDIIPKITDLKMIQYILAHNTCLEILINDKKVKCYPSFRLKRDCRDEHCYIDDLSFIEY